jgi:5-methyltetrahydropteroyltriglutamate--homocysteine methyltransferase
LTHIEAERLIVAPDCGLGFLTRDLAMQKLTNMAEAARAI